MSMILSQAPALHSVYSRKAAENRAAAVKELAPGTTRILRLPAVEAMTGVKKSTIYKGMARGTFPKTVPIGDRARGWIEAEVIAWQESRINQREAV